MNTCNIHWITTWDEALSPATWRLWMKHYEESVGSSVFLHPDLGFTWLAVYRKVRDLQPLFCVAEKNGQSLFYPLVIWTKNYKHLYQRKVVTVGFSDFDYLEPLIIGKGCGYYLNCMLEEIAKKIVHKFKVDSIEFGGIREKNPFWSNHNYFRKEHCPVLHLSQYADYSDFLNSLKSSFRGDLKRQQRRLGELGELTLRVFDKEDNCQIIKELFTMLGHHRKRWPRAYKAPDFHKKIVESALKARVLHFSALQLNGVSISWNIGFYAKKRFYYYLPAIDPEYQNYSPGKIHLLMLNKWAIENDAEIFDHLRGDEAYKSSWTDNGVMLYSYRVNSSNPISLLRNSWVGMVRKIRM